MINQLLLIGLKVSSQKIKIPIHLRSWVFNSIIPHLLDTKLDKLNNLNYYMYIAYMLIADRKEGSDAKQI